jgi:hypothetical protein
LLLPQLLFLLYLLQQTLVQLRNCFVFQTSWFHHRRRCILKRSVHQPSASGSAVLLSVLITDDSLMKVVAESGEEVDEVAVLANIRPIIGAARDMRMTLKLCSLFCGNLNIAVTCSFLATILLLPRFTATPLPFDALLSTVYTSTSSFPVTSSTGTATTSTAVSCAFPSHYSYVYVCGSIDHG